MLSPQLMLMLSWAGASTNHNSSGDYPATPTTGTSDTIHSRCGGLSLATLTTTMARGAPMLSPQLMLMLSWAGASTSHSSSGDHPATPITGAGLRDITSLDTTKNGPALKKYNIFGCVLEWIIYTNTQFFLLA